MAATKTSRTIKASATNTAGSTASGTELNLSTAYGAVLMARTDAHAVEGLQAAIDRSNQYVDAGADMIFAEALTAIDEYKRFTAAVRVPVLANLTEFGIAYVSYDQSLLGGYFVVVFAKP